MNTTSEYVLGQSERAARRLEIQDAHFADVSEKLLDELALKASERVVEFGCGAGSFTRRVLRRLGAGSVLVGVDCTPGLLEQAKTSLADARFQPVLADISQLGPWLDGADVIVARTMLHHIPMVELFLGRLLARLKPGTRIGFLEPDFRIPLARLAFLEATTRPELAPLRVWAIAINHLYLATQISPDVGATLAQTLATAGCQDVRGEWMEGRADERMIENMLMFFDEVGERLQSLGILTAAEIADAQRRLRALPTDKLPATWGIHRVTCVV